MRAISDTKESGRFVEALEARLGSSVLDPSGTFVCTSQDQCRDSAAHRGMQFAAGQLSYVGDRYACAVDGRPFRVLIVSMQVGDAEAPVTMARRSEQITARIPETAGRRNPHMRGVTRALQLLHDTGPDNEHLSDGTHVLRTFAMANSVLCSALPTGGKSRRGKPTDVMLGNCASHLGDTLDILDPTIIHTQGVDTRAAVERLVHVLDRHSDEVSTVEFRGRRMVLCATSHPAAGPPRSWSSLKPGSYFAETVAPALALARGIALKVRGAVVPPE